MANHSGQPWHNWYHCIGNTYGTWLPVIAAGSVPGTAANTLTAIIATLHLRIETSNAVTMRDA